MDEQGGAAYWDLMLNDETARYVYRLYATKQVMAQKLDQQTRVKGKGCGESF